MDQIRYSKSFKQLLSLSSAKNFGIPDLLSWPRKSRVITYFELIFLLHFLLDYSHYRDKKDFQKFNIFLWSILKVNLIYFDADARTLLLFGHHYHLKQNVQLDDEVQMNISREISKDIITTTYMYDQFLDGWWTHTHRYFSNLFISYFGQFLYIDYRVEFK